MTSWCRLLLPIAAITKCFPFTLQCDCCFWMAILSLSLVPEETMSFSRCGGDASDGTLSRTASSKPLLLVNKWLGICQTLREGTWVPVKCLVRAGPESTLINTQLCTTYVREGKWPVSNNTDYFGNCGERCSGLYMSCGKLHCMLTYCMLESMQCPVLNLSGRTLMSKFSKFICSVTCLVLSSSLIPVYALFWVQQHLKANDLF